MQLTAGLTAETDVVVEDHLTADRMGNAGFNVLSTPALIQLFEATSIQTIAPHQDVPLTGSVGTRNVCRHARALHGESRQRRWTPRLLRPGSA